jgi:hypothetical protein
VFLYAGLRSLFGRTEVFLSSDTVEVVRKGVRRARRWEEPLRAFTGVLRRAVHHASDDGPDYTEYQLLLAHNDPEKQVQLFNFRFSQARTAWRGALGMLVSGGIAAGARMMQPQFPNDTLLVVFTWLMAGFVLISFGSLKRSLRSHEELTVTRYRVEYQQYIFFYRL